MNTTSRHVFALPTDEDGVYEAVDVGEAATIEEALKVLRDAGYTIIEEGNGGAYETYDAEDGPQAFGYKANTMGAFGITVEITE